MLKKLANTESERDFKEVFVHNTQEILLNLPGVAEDSHDRPRSGPSVSLPRFESETVRIKLRDQISWS